MSASAGEHRTIEIDSTHRVSAVFDRPRSARAALILAHGAGTDMEHPSMRSLASGLVERGIATLRYQFPYAARRTRRPDPPALCHATVRAAAIEASRVAPDLPLFAGGRSFGGRMTSQAQAQSPLPQVRGLVFLAFPLHPAGQPETTRAMHLASVTLPMLFIQGDRDALAELGLLKSVVEQLGALATLHLLENADHSFHVPARSSRNDAQVREEYLDFIGEWLERFASPGHSSFK